MKKLSNLENILYKKKYEDINKELMTPEELITKSKKELKDICKKYKFRYKEIDDKRIALCAKNTDREWQEWITLDLDKRKVNVWGNTDQCNFWFCQTRKDMIPDTILELTSDINKIIRKFDTYVKVSTLIDPEDWQEIANVKNAYEDTRYKLKFKNIYYENNNYIGFTVYYKEDELDGFFRMEDLENSYDIRISHIYYTKESEYFIDAHIDEIEEEIYQFINRNIEKREEKKECSNKQEEVKDIEEEEEQ